MNKQEILNIVYQYADEHLNKKIFVPGVSPVPASGAVLYPEDITEVADALLEFWYTDWKKCAEFKRRLCHVTGKKYCVLVNSGSSASLIAQTALLKKSSKKYVVTTALGFPTTVYPIYQNGKVPIFIDTDPVTLSPVFEQFKTIYRFGHEIEYQIFTHTLGFPFDERKVSDEPFISDGCDALGSKLNYAHGWHHVGIFADAMTLSFFPAHHITSGEGGCILTDDEELAKEMECLTNWGRDCYCLPGQSNTCGKRFNQDFEGLPEGWDHKYTFTRLGYNLKMTEFQAALGLSQLTHLDDFVNARRNNYSYLLSQFQEFNPDYVQYGVSIPDCSRPSPFGFPIIVKSSLFTAQELIAYLEKAKISTRRFFGGNLTRQPFIKDLSYTNLDLSGTDYIMENGFWIGCHVQLTKAHLDYVIDIFGDFFKEKGLI